MLFSQKKALLYTQFFLKEYTTQNGQIKKQNYFTSNSCFNERILPGTRHPYQTSFFYAIIKGKNIWPSSPNRQNFNQLDNLTRIQELLVILPEERLESLNQRLLAISVFQRQALYTEIIITHSLCFFLIATLCSRLPGLLQLIPNDLCLL